jgi:hypothetical protein
MAHHASSAVCPHGGACTSYDRSIGMHGAAGMPPDEISESPPPVPPLPRLPPPLPLPEALWRSHVPLCGCVSAWPYTWRSLYADESSVMSTR